MHLRPFKALVAGTFLFTQFAGYSQISFGGSPRSFERQDLSGVPVITMPPVDVEGLLAEDAAREAAGLKGPWRFGHNHLVDLGTANSGIWEIHENGDRTWRLVIESPGAYSINFEFHEYVVPDGAEVFVYNEAGEHLGAFTAESNPGHTVLGVTQIAGDRITIEYYEPAAVAGTGSLRVGQVTHAYKDVLGTFRGLNDSGICNRNVICPQGDHWREQIRSVAMITVGGNGQCTGQLINNCENDGTPYFLTARHCLPWNGNVGGWVFRFNWESPVCAQNVNGPVDQTVSGASLKIQSQGTDVALLELNTAPPDAYNVFYSGWDRSAVAPTSSTAIHHPSGDIKKISRDDHAAVTATYFGAACWRVLNWEDGTTEPGSSGSGLWNQQGLLVGQLFGGQAECDNNVNDYYGRFDVSFPLLEEWLGDCGPQLTGHPLTTNVLEETSAQEFTVYPNPSSGGITVALPVFQGAMSLQLHDATGRLLGEQMVPAGTPSLAMDLSRHVEGIYFLHLRGEGVQQVLRVVITR